MKYKHFEDLPVWQEGVDLATRVFAITQDNGFHGQGDVANQLQRAALSVSNNIAEGFERGSTAELLQFLYYAKGSAGEVRSMCYVMERLAGLAHLTSEISDLKSSSRSICKQTGAWAFSLQETDIRGSRHLTDHSRQSYQQKQKGSAFLQDIHRQYEEQLEAWKQKRGS